MYNHKLRVPVIGTELEIYIKNELTAENPFGKIIHYMYILNGQKYKAYLEIPFSMEKEDVVHKIVSETLNQMLSRVTWLAIMEEYNEFN